VYKIWFFIIMIDKTTELYYIIMLVFLIENEQLCEWYIYIHCIALWKIYQFKKISSLAYSYLYLIL